MSERDHLSVRVEQVNPRQADVAANAEFADDAIARARSDGVDLLVFPELYLTGYHLPEDERDALVSDAIAALDDLEPRTEGVTVVIGTPVRERGVLHNSAVVLDDGTLAGTYHKTHLYDSERAVFEPGTAISVIETRAGPLGVQICYDVEFPEVSRRLVLEGAELLVTISANMRPFENDQEIYLPARALENVCPHVLCNRVGTERGTQFFGASGLADERGRSVLQAGTEREIELTADLDLSAGGAETLSYLEDRRPELYVR